MSILRAFERSRNKDRAKELRRKDRAGELCRQDCAGIIAHKQLGKKNCAQKTCWTRELEIVTVEE